MADDINQAVLDLAAFLEQLAAWADLGEKTRKKKAQPRVPHRVIIGLETFLKKRGAGDQASSIDESTLGKLIATLPQVEDRALIPVNVLSLLGCMVCRIKQSKVKVELHGELESWLECMTKEEAKTKKTQWTEDWIDLLWRTFADTSSPWDHRMGAISMMSKLQEGEASIKQIVMQIGYDHKTLLSVGDALMTAPEFHYIKTLARFIRMLLPTAMKDMETRTKLFLRESYFSRAVCDALREYMGDNPALALAINDERVKHGTALATLELQDVSDNDGKSWYKANEGQVVISQTAVTVLFLVGELWSNWHIAFHEVAGARLDGPIVVLKSKATFECTSTRAVHLEFVSDDQARDSIRHLPAGLRPPMVVRSAIATIDIPPLSKQVVRLLTTEEQANEAVARSPSPTVQLPPTVKTGLGPISAPPSHDLTTNSTGETQAGNRSPDLTASTATSPRVSSQPLADEPVPFVPVIASQTETRVETVRSVLTAAVIEPDRNNSVIQIAPPRSAQRQRDSQPEASPQQTIASLQPIPPELVSSVTSISAAESPERARIEQVAPEAPVPAQVRPSNNEEVESLLNVVAHAQAREIVPRHQRHESSEPEGAPDAAPESPVANARMVGVRAKPELTPELPPSRKQPKSVRATAGRRNENEVVSSEVSSLSFQPVEKKSTTIRKAVTTKRFPTDDDRPAEGDEETDYDIPDSPLRTAGVGQKGKPAKKAKNKPAAQAKTAARKTRTREVNIDDEENEPIETRQDVTVRETRASTSKRKNARRDVQQAMPEQARSKSTNAEQKQSVKRKGQSTGSGRDVSGPSKTAVSPLSLPRVEHLVNDNAVKRPEVVHWTKEGPRRLMPGGTQAEPDNQMDAPMVAGSLTPERQSASAAQGSAPDDSMANVNKPSEPPLLSSQEELVPVPSMRKQPMSQEIVTPHPTKRTDGLLLQRLLSSSDIPEQDDAANITHPPSKQLPERLSPLTAPGVPKKTVVPRMSVSAGPSFATNTPAAALKQSQLPRQGQSAAPMAGFPQAHALSTVITPPDHIDWRITTPANRPRGRKQMPNTEHTLGVRTIATSTIAQLERTLQTLLNRHAKVDRQQESTPTRPGPLHAPKAANFAKGPEVTVAATTKPQGPTSSLHELLKERGLLPQQNGQTKVLATSLAEDNHSSSSEEEPQAKRAKYNKRGKDFRSSLPAMHREAYATLESAAQNVLRNIQQSEAQMKNKVDHFAVQCDRVLEAYRDDSRAFGQDLLDHLNSEMRSRLST